MVLVSAPVLLLPLIASGPAQPPEAVQLVALVELQVSIDELPLETTLGLADREAVGTGATVTVAEAVGLAPPPPLQLIK